VCVCVCVFGCVGAARHEWKQQVEDMESRDRLSLQEDIEIRGRAFSAEKALTLTLERLRTLERAAGIRFSLFVCFCCILCSVCILAFFEILSRSSANFFGAPC